MANKETFQVEISRFQNGKFDPITIPCEIIKENATSYQIRTTLPDGQTLVIRKKKAKVISPYPKEEPKPETPKKEKSEEKVKSKKSKAKQKSKE